MKNESTSRNNVLLQPNSQSNEETTYYSNNVNTDFLTNVAAVTPAVVVEGTTKQGQGAVKKGKATKPNSFAPKDENQLVTPVIANKRRREERAARWENDFAEFARYKLRKGGSVRLETVMSVFSQGCLAKWTALNRSVEEATIAPDEAIHIFRQWNDKYGKARLDGHGVFHGFHMIGSPGEPMKARTPKTATAKTTDEGVVTSLQPSSQLLEKQKLNKKKKNVEKSVLKKEPSATEQDPIIDEVHTSLMNNMENKATSCDNTCNDVNAGLSTKVAAAAASLDTDLEKNETFSEVSRQTKTKYYLRDHTIGDTLIRSKLLQDGQVPEDLQRLVATKMDNSSIWDSDVEKMMESVTKHDKTADVDRKKHAAVQHQQPQDAATIPSTTVSAHPPRPLVLPTAAADSVRRHYVSSTQQATASRLIANSAVNSLSQQRDDVSNASTTQAEDLVVAWLVKEDDVHTKIQKVRARRNSRRLYFVVFLLIAAAALITPLVIIKRNKDNKQVQEQETELTLSQNMTQLIVSIMGADAVLLNDTWSPYAKALTWLLQSNERNESQEVANTLAQRFYAASFYFDTTNDVDKWTACNPHISSSELDQTCYGPYQVTYQDTMSQAWLSDSHECDWYGVRCDNHSQIVELFFQGMNLVGTIPSCTVKFPFLQKLILAISQLEGNISLLTDCPHLTHIIFDQNQLLGNLSSVWQNRKLKNLDASYNHFTGSLSSQIGNLVDAKYLRFSGNELNGTVPSEVGWLDSISDFDIYANSVRGGLPSSMQFWSMIEHFEFSSNSLSGSIPTFLGQLNKTLQILDLFQNKFTGTLPIELFHLTELYRLDVSNNELSGTLDSHFAQLISLQRHMSINTLALRDNYFSGTIPTELGLLTDLTYIYLFGNDFTGSVPASLCRNETFKYAEFMADCAKDDTGRAELQCDCCTHCCQANGSLCQPTQYASGTDGSSG